MVHIDHVTISDVRFPSKKNILIVVDGFSKFTKIYATKTTTAEEVIDKLKVYCQYYSKPKTVSKIKFALNNSVHKTTGEIPSVLLFRITQRGKTHDPISEFVNNGVNNGTRCLDLV